MYKAQELWADAWSLLLQSSSLYISEEQCLIFISERCMVKALGIVTVWQLWLSFFFKLCLSGSFLFLVFSEGNRLGDSFSCWSIQRPVLRPLIVEKILSQYGSFRFSHAQIKAWGEPVMDDSWLQTDQVCRKQLSYTLQHQRNDILLLLPSHNSWNKSPMIRQYTVCHDKKSEMRSKSVY